MDRRFGFATVTDRTLSLVVHPDARGHGLGTALLDDGADGQDQKVLEAWSHADHPAARSWRRDTGSSGCASSG